MPKKIKPAKKRPSAKLVAGARDYVLDAYDTAAGLLTQKECRDLIAVLREDLELRRFAMDWHGARHRKIPAARARSAS